MVAQTSLSIIDASTINHQHMQSIVKDKSFYFAIRIIQLYKFLCAEKREFVLSKQVLRSGTSIGANIHEALQGSSRKDFIAKMSISLREAHESAYWLMLLNASNYISKSEFESIHDECIELIKILTSIVKTSKQNKVPIN